MTESDSLIGLLNPKPNSTIMIYDVHASESGALAILDDLYQQICTYEDKTVKWVFVVSIPEYKETSNITIRRYSWVKKNWGYRYYFEMITTRRIIKEFNPDKVLSLQNKGIKFYKKEQLVYLHLPFILTDHKFDIKIDGKKLWLYQNVISKSIFSSLRKVNRTIVQTQWMKVALVKKAGVSAEKVTVQQPDITSNHILNYEDIEKNRKTIFYPATAFTYKNHMTLLKALTIIQKQGIKDYETVFTIRTDESDYTQRLKKYTDKHDLNVEFRGQIPREKVFELYSKSILVFPSYVESFGLPLLEAKLTGTYIIASDCPFCREILEEYDKVQYFTEMDEKMLAREIISVMKGKEM